MKLFSKKISIALRITGEGEGLTWKRWKWARITRKENAWMGRGQGPFAQNWGANQQYPVSFLQMRSIKSYCHTNVIPAKAGMTFVFMRSLLI